MSLLVEAATGLVTVQDRGRIGFAHLGVPRGGPLDRPAADLANRLVGNAVDAAVLEVTVGTLAVVSSGGVWVAITGARSEVVVDGAAGSFARPQWVPAGGHLDIGLPREGMRTYVAVAGGVEVEPVLGSRSTDTLAWLGPPRVTEGQTLPVGVGGGPPAEHETPRPPPFGRLRVRPGPRSEWFSAEAWSRLTSTSYVVGADSNRIGVRLTGEELTRARSEELPSEGVVLGAIQVPSNGQPVVFLADHPTTGGYPVIGVVDEADLWQLAQTRPGDAVRFKAAS